MFYMFYNTLLNRGRIYHHHNFSFLIGKVCNYDLPQLMSKAKSTNDSHDDQAVMVVVNTCHERLEICLNRSAEIWHNFRVFSHSVLTGLEGFSGNTTVCGSSCRMIDGRRYWSNKSLVKFSWFILNSSDFLALIMLKFIFTFWSNNVFWFKEGTQKRCFAVFNIIN